MQDMVIFLKKVKKITPDCCHKSLGTNIKFMILGELTY